MNKIKFYLYISCFLAISLGLSGCKNKKEPDKVNQEVFEKKALLANMADHIIRPNLASLQSSVQTLTASLETFTQSPNAIHLEKCRNDWEIAFIDFLHCNAFNFGPGEKPVIGMMNENLSIWPVHTTRVEERIQNGQTNFSDFERDSRGFQTLEYLLYEPQALSRFQDSLSAPQRIIYTKAVLANIKQWVDEMNVAWVSYRDVFVANDGKDVGSSTSMLYNEFLKSYEGIKNFKIGIPAGARAGQTQIEPKKVESYYSGLSTLHIMENFKAVENIWRGRSRSGNEGIGFDDWLGSLADGASLKNQTQDQFIWMNSKNTDMNDSTPLSQKVQSDLPVVQDWFNEYQKFTRYIKSDLSSLIGIAITFSSGDGD